jgi:pimeloyl-ACP methyl ester carboxylesterase
MGGSTVFDFALDHPDRIESLVLIGTGVSGFKAAPERAKLWAEVAAFMERGEIERAIEHEIRMLVDGPGRMPEQVNPLVRKKVREMERNNAAHEAEGLTATAPPRPAINRLAEMTAPTLLLIGDHEVADLAELAHRLARELPNADLKVIPDAAHLPSMEQPALVNQHIATFLFRVTEGS